MTSMEQSERGSVPALVTAYFAETPDAGAPGERVAFGTSGHRGTALRRSFNEAHIAAVCAAIAEHRREAGIDGPLFLGLDTHALSEAAYATALEVFAAHEVSLVVESASRYTPTPVISHAILRHNRGRSSGLADGVILTPSHNPPEDGGIKYNPPSGGPADTSVTSSVERRANELLAAGLDGIPRVAMRNARDRLREADLAGAYIADLGEALELDAVAAANVRIGVDPMGGAAIDLWDRVAEAYGLAIDVVNRDVDAGFRFMPRDWDGRIRMDCSSPHAMAGLLALKNRYDVAFGNDPDADRHGIVTPSAGLLNPNHFLAAAIDHLFRTRERWAPDAAIGKTLVSSALIDRVAQRLRRRVVEVPVGFKWFVPGLLDGSIAFGGEESAGASFVRRDGSVWTTDKDGILLGLLAAEMTARAGHDPGVAFAALAAELGEPHYTRIDSPATPEQKRALAALTSESVRAEMLAGERIVARLTHATGNGEAIGGLKVVTANGWFAARPSGTEDVYKIYAESFTGENHLARVVEEAKAIVAEALKNA